MSGTFAAQPLKRINVGPAPRSVPAHRPPPAPRSAPAPPFSATSAHRSAPAQAIFRPLRSISAHAPLKCFASCRELCLKLMVSVIEVVNGHLDTSVKVNEFISRIA